MKRILGLFALLAFSTLPAMAQSDAFARVEAGGGFNFRDFGAPFQANFNEIGWFATGQFNFTSWLSLAANVDGGYASPFDTDTRQYTAVFGPRVYPLRHHRIAPFGEALFGISHFSFPDIQANNGGEYTDNASDIEFGGGVDFKLTHHIAFRVAEVDFEHTRNFDVSEGNPTQNSLSVKTGVVVRF